VSRAWDLFLKNNIFYFESIKIGIFNFSHLVHALIDCKKPVIALINGPTIGIGVTSLGLVDAVYSSDKVKKIYIIRNISV